MAIVPTPAASGGTTAVGAALAVGTAGCVPPGTGVPDAGGVALHAARRSARAPAVRSEAFIARAVAEAPSAGKRIHGVNGEAFSIFSR